MLTQIDRYLIREILLAFGACVLVLLAMVLSHRLAAYMSQAASGLLAREAIFLLLSLQAIRFLVMLIPLALLLSVMLALGRMYRDSEMTAMGACGIGPGAVYGALFKLGVPLAAGLAGLSLYLLPWTMTLQFQVLDQARAEAELSAFRAGVFREVAGGQHVVYIGHLGADGNTLEDVFVRSVLPEGIAVTSADSGEQEIDVARGARYLVLRDGYRYEGTPGRGDYQRLAFEQLRLRLDAVPEERGWRRRETLATAELLQSAEPEHAAELHARLSGPISVLVLLVLAPLLARSNPREGRYGRLVGAVLLYVLYFNLLGIGDTRLKMGRHPASLGLWWVHGSMLAIALLLGAAQLRAWWQQHRRVTA